MLVFSVVIGRRTIPVFWVTIFWYQSMVDTERSAFASFSKLLQPGQACVVVADRGFGTVRLLRYLRDELGMSFVIRVKEGAAIRRPRVSDVTEKEAVGQPAEAVTGLSYVEKRTGTRKDGTGFVTMT